MKTDFESEALAAALNEYRKIYPEGTIAQEIEEKASLNVLSGESKEILTIVICYWIKNQKEPFYFFEAQYDKRSKKILVVKAEEPNQLRLSILSEDTAL